MTALRDALAANRARRAPKRRRKTEEHDFQATAYEYLEIVLPPSAIVTSLDLADARSAVTGAQRKRRGCLPGVPDLYAAYGATTIWFECKAAKGKLSDDQKAFRDAARANGHWWCAPQQLEDIRGTLLAAGIPVRAVTLL